MSASRFRLSPSPRLAVLLATLHGCGAAAAFAALPGMAGTVLTAGLLGLGAAAIWSRALLRTSRAMAVLEVAGDRLAIELRNGERLEGEASPRRYVSRLAVVVLLRRPRRAVLVARDMLDPESFRALRVWALWGRAPGAGVAGKQLQA